MWRLVTLAATAVIGAVAAGRRMARDRVDRDISVAVEQAGRLARREIHDQAVAMAQAHLRRFAMALLVKFTLVSLLLGARELGWLDPDVFRTGLLALLALFLARDLHVTWRPARFLFIELKATGWSVRRAVSELVAAEAFRQVLARASEESLPPGRKLLMELAGRSHDQAVNRIAREVADIARQTSWDDISPVLRSTVIGTLGLLAFYSVFILLALGSAS